ncbi:MULTISPECIES: DUF5327 family protein [Staphylococcus]|uniref:DUF5327 family protein n=1 Tax=Staphylococcus TaxID=1279 RepID=UPI0002991F7B|nr:MULTISPECIES: DUF5327 family protein [Staphylococcus]RAA72196.1 hypothetical protein DN475_31080 [Burkholderia multivorans]AVO03003.1 hypothetical protein BI282_11470 [Staphylococcus simulans]AVO05958.1 hypothetical protein BI283_11485 [Staphylococcus simulans]AWG19551.1 hypothetical protein A9958_11475 [Staphylococcus simulans]AWI02501.1 hypothetical protein A7X73_11365 [Staphylococcus simulans]
MNKEKLIALIERELVQADEAASEAEFSKHMYAIHTLTSLYTDSDSSDVPARSSKQTSMTYQQAPSVTSPSYTTSSHSQVSAAEIKAMGGKVSSQQNSSNLSTPPGNSNKMVTDDELGNGDSIFDF